MTDEERVNNVIRVKTQLGEKAWTSKRLGDEDSYAGRHDTAAYHWGKERAYRDAYKMLRKAFNPDYPEDAL